MTNIVQVKDCELVYQGKERKQIIFRDFNLDIQEREFVMITGKSGVGKSSLLNLIMGLTRPDKGKIIVCGKDINATSVKDLNDFRNKKIGFVFQSFELIFEMTVLENVMIPLLIRGENKKIAAKKAAEILTAMGLENEKNKFPRVLSGGEQQRVAISRSIINNPDLILADEPTGNLDKESAMNVISILTKLNNEGKTIVMVTHDETLLKFATRVVELS